MAEQSEESKQITALIIQYLRGSLSEKDAVILNSWIDLSEDNNEFMKTVQYESKKEKAWKLIQDKILFEDEVISSYEKNKTTLADSPQIITDARIINRTLLDIARNDFTYIHKMNDRQFEEFIAELFEKQGYNVTLTPQTRDGGKDLFILEDRTLGKFLYYLECKKLAPHRPVGVRMVRELYGTVMRDRATAGILVTSSYFSDPSKDFTEAISNQMSLIDYNKLCKIIKDI